MESEQIVQLDPAKVLIGENVRFGIKKLAVQQLADSIKEVGAVLSPVEVEQIEGDKAHPYRLTSGYIRHAAVTLLNAEGAGLTLPAIVRPLEDNLTRLKHQLAENVARESMSPMDQAVAIKKLLDEKVARTEIRRIFSRPGGRKGLQTQPASNAYLNMTMSFLDLPKPIQTKIHEGLVGVAAAYELTKVTPEKRQAVLERAEAQRLADIEREEKEEERYLRGEQKLAEMAKEEVETSIALSNAKLEVEAAKKQVAERIEAGHTAYKALKAAKGDKEQKAAQETFQSAEVDIKGAQKHLVGAEKALDKLQGRAKTISETSAQHKEALAAARKKAGKPAATKAVGPAAVKKAAIEEGASTSYVRLNASEMRTLIEDLCLPGTYKMVQEIAKVIKECFDGITTPKQVYNALAVLTGERAAASNKSAEMPKKKPTA